MIFQQLSASGYTKNLVLKDYLFICIPAKLQLCGKCLSLYKKFGGSIITVGSDAHRTEDIAVPYADAENLIRAAGFTEISVFMGRKATQVRL